MNNIKIYTLNIESIYILSDYYEEVGDHIKSTWLKEELTDIPFEIDHRSGDGRGYGDGSGSESGSGSGDGSGSGRGSGYGDGYGRGWGDGDGSGWGGGDGSGR